MKRTSMILRALVLAGALGTTACDMGDILSVEPAALIPATDLETPANAALLVNGAAADFDCAFNSYAAVTALMSGEFVDALQTADRWPYHQRTVAPNQSRYATFSCTALGLYTPLQSARVAANNVRRLMEGWTDVEVPNRQLLIARASAYEGWAQLLIAEVFQETVFSTVTGETVNWGTVISRANALDSAVVRFTSAIGIATTVGGVAADSVRYFALAGRARALHSLAYIANAANPDLTAARADANVVPAAFQWRTTASGTVARRQNRIFQESSPTVTQQNASVGVYYRTLGDPRVPVQNMNRNSNGTNVPQWAQLKYTAVASPIAVATGAEMQLLIAEADRQGATCAASTQLIIATFRTAGAQTPYVACTSAAADLAEIQDQRRRALWLQGTYLGDVIRYNLMISPSQGTATPWGQTYGPDAGNLQLLPLPDVERFNNPAI